jgi:hypothetical protein
MRAHRLFRVLAGGAIMQGKVMLRVDTRGLSGLVERMRACHSKGEFNKLMYRAFQRTGPRVRSILKKEVPADYMASPGWIGAQVGNPQMSMGAEVGCTIPVSGVRGRIGSQYSATATSGGGRITTGYTGRRGKRTRRAYKVMAKIVTAGASALPDKGDAVHFMVFSGPNRGRVYARLNKSGTRIRPAVGIGVPQMPTNRSEKAVQEGILEVLKQRIEHEHTALIMRYAK